jgi:hypothetical protein
MRLEERAPVVLTLVGDREPVLDADEDALDRLDELQEGTGLFVSEVACLHHRLGVDRQIASTTRSTSLIACWWTYIFLARLRPPQRDRLSRRSFEW